MTEIEALVRRQYEHQVIVGCYIDNARNLGLWESERLLFDRFFDPREPVLDIGCGAGRVAFGLYEMGFSNVTGLDISPRMIDAGRSDAMARGIPIEFICGDAGDMPFEDEAFHACIFSFNGLMTIPFRESRRRALKEIRRVLHPKGVFLFTTHLRGAGNSGGFWQEEEENWQAGCRDPRLEEFGDLVFPDTISEIPVEGFIHVPTEDEVLEDLALAGLRVTYVRPRNEIVVESPAVAAQTNNCVFWATMRL